MLGEEQIRCQTRDPFRQGVGGGVTAGSPEEVAFDWDLRGRLWSKGVPSRGTCLSNGERVGSGSGSRAAYLLWLGLGRNGVEGDEGS